MQTFTPSDIKYTYSPTHDPIGTVGAGEAFTVITEDCFTARFRNAEDFNEESAAWVEQNLDGVTGPVARSTGHRPARRSPSGSSAST